LSFTDWQKEKTRQRQYELPLLPILEGNLGNPFCIYQTIFDLSKPWIKILRSNLNQIKKEKHLASPFSYLQMDGQDG
jgi:hypothetical protein